MKGRIGDKQRLLQIVDSISEIEQYISGASFEHFLQHSMMRFATIKQLEIIGEAANYISEETKSRFTEIQWRQIIGLRHILVHEYFGVDSNLVWQIIANDLPDLKQKVQEVLASLESQ